MIAAQAMNHGNLSMSRTSDIPYHVLEATYQQYLRLQTLQAANDRISNAIAELPIFPHYSFDLETMYGAVDGQLLGETHDGFVTVPPSASATVNTSKERAVASHLHSLIIS